MFQHDIRELCRLSQSEIQVQLTIVHASRGQTLPSKGNKDERNFKLFQTLLDRQNSTSLSCLKSEKVECEIKRTRHRIDRRCMLYVVKKRAFGRRWNENWKRDTRGCDERGGFNYIWTVKDCLLTARFGKWSRISLERIFRDNIFGYFWNSSWLFSRWETHKNSFN